MTPAGLSDSIGGISISGISRSTRLMRRRISCIVCLGIGENGHIAFNDPPVADFLDSATVKRVELEEACLQQQVNDGCFGDIA